MTILTYLLTILTAGGLLLVLGSLILGAVSGSSYDDAAYESTFALGIVMLIVFGVLLVVAKVV